MPGSTTRGITYKAFISYSHADERWASWLHRSLETYRVPRHIVVENGLPSNRLIPVFRDRDDLATSGDLSATIEQALENSENLIVVCSPDAAGSHWVNEEILLFKRLGKTDRIFCLLVDEAYKSFPSAVLGEAEPLAADVADDADGKQGAKLKIAASVLGVSLDKLKRREVQRRNRRLFAISATTTVGMVFSFGLTAYAFQQQQRAEAEAETSRQVTEFLLSTFKQADPRFYGSADPSVSEMLRQGALRLEHELHDQPVVRARLMATIGSVFLGNSLAREAEELLAEALVLQQQQFGLHRLELVGTMQDLAQAREFTGDEQSMNQLFAETIEIQERLGTDLDVADGLLKWGQYATNAEGLLMRSLAIVETQDPESKLHARVLQALGHHHFDWGDLERSLSYHQAAAVIQEANGQQQEMTFTLSGIAGVLGYMGETDRSLAMHQRAVALTEEVFGPDHPYTGTQLNDLAAQFHVLGNLEQALPLYERALAIAESRLGPQSGLRRIILTNLGELERDRGDFPRSRKLFDQAVGVYRESSGKVPAYLTGQIALLLLAEKRYDEAQLAFGKYFAYFEGGTPSGNPSHIPIIEGYEKLLVEVGDKQ